MYLGHTAMVSGGEIALERMLLELKKLIDPIVVLAEDGPMVERLRRSGLDVRVLEMNSSTTSARKDHLFSAKALVSRVTSTLRYATAVSGLIKELDIDIVHTNTLKAGYYGSIAARMAGVPSVWHLRDRLSSDYLPVLPIITTRLLMLLMPAAIITNSRSTRDTLGWVLRKKSATTFDVPSPLEHRALTVARPEDVQAPPLGPQLVLVGRLAPWKGQQVAVEAFAQLRPMFGGCLHIVGSAMFGETEYVESLRARVETMGLSASVKFHGYVENAFEHLGEFDILLHTSISPEPFGQVIVEGMAAGLAVVAADAGGPAEIITHRENGLLYKPGDSNALASAVCQLMADSTLREKVTSGGLERAKAFSPEVISKQVLAIYNQVAEGSSK